MALGDRLKQLSHASNTRRVVVEIDGKRKIVEAPRDMSNADIQREIEKQTAPKQKPTSFWQGVAEGFHPVAQNVDRVVNAINPVAWATDALGLSDTAADRQFMDRKFREAQAQSPVRGSTLGKIAGGILGTAPTAFIPGGPVVQGAAAGALMNETGKPLDIARDAALGAAGGYFGDVVGRRVVAPVAERIGRTAPVRAVGEAATKLANKIPGVTTRQLPAAPKFTAADRATNRMAPALDDVRQNLSDAADLGLPFSLADASPQTRLLAGSVARNSPDARMLAEQTFHPRAVGQADRAIDAIDNYLAPITNIEKRGADIRTAAQTASRPFYEAAGARAAPVDEQVAAMLQSPAGKDAMRSAFSIAQNEGLDPRGIGFNLNDQGEVVLQEAPTFQTLQLIKRGLDAKLSKFRNPITGRLDLEGNPEAQSINSLLTKFNNRLGDLNPDYAAGNAAYADIIRRRDALNLGNRLAANNAPMRKFEAGLGRMNESTMPEMQRGYATAMGDTVEKMRFSGNPYNAVYGSPLQQQKVGKLFPKAGMFGRQYKLEKDMADTAYETLGGSPTQSRAMADKLFSAESPALTMAEMVSSPKTGIAKAAANALKDRIRTGGEARAKEMAPTLFNTDPNWALSYLDELMRKNADQAARQRAYQGAGSLLGLPAAVALPVASQ